MASVEEDLDSDDQDYGETIDENEYIHRRFKEYPSCRAFLSRTEKVYARSVKLDSSAAEVWLNYSTDIDGCVVELNDLASVNMAVRHLTLCPSDKAKLHEVKPLLKKHIDLKQYSRDARAMFKHCVGLQLFYADGWECQLGIIPDSEVGNIGLSREVIRNIAVGAFEQLKDCFRMKLVTYVKDGIARRTLLKNDLNDPRRIFVLPDDVPAMLAALQSAVASISVMYFKPIVFCFRFGEKMVGGLSLSAFKTEDINKVTVHAAVDISSQVDGIDLLWSMQGIQKVVGTRGTVSTCLSLTDCGNFQSNLDGRATDIKPALRKVCFHPENVLFVQMYADLPHLKPNTRFHPVSGAIAGGVCFPKRTADAFTRDAEKYVSVVDTNFALMSISTCRLEVVTEVRNVPDRIEGLDVISLCKLDNLLETYGLIVPMPRASLSCIQSVGVWLSSELKDMLLHFARTGNVEATWRAYQFELAVEKLLWGRPLCFRSYRYSVNLGPGVLGASRSLSDELGFLALEPHTSCMVFENSIPHPAIWTISDRIGKCILRSVGLHDHIDASYPVVGRLLLTALLKDLHDVGKVANYIRYEEFLAALKAKDAGLQIRGAVTVETLVDVLVSKRRMSVNMVYGDLCRLVEKNGIPLKEIVSDGLAELELQQFPAVQTYDAHRNPSLTWNFKNGFWKIAETSSEASNGSSSELYTQLVRGELERRGLIFPSKLKNMHGIWPWIAPCLRKLSQERLSREGLILTLTFVSAVAFAMNDWFVDFDRFAALFTDLPMKQYRLKCLEIQSKLQFAKFNFDNLRIYRLHHSIPHQVKVPEKKDKGDEKSSALPSEDLFADHDTRQMILEDDDTADQCIATRPSTCLTAGVVKKIWTGEELEILCDLAPMKSQKNSRELYDMFITRCMGKSVPFRTYQSFRRKLFKI